MKKTLYYDIIFREIGRIYNEGFLVVNLNDERIISMEGVLTFDYIKAEMKESNLVIEYYILDESSQTLTLEYVFLIQKDELEIPFNERLKGVDGRIVEIVTQKRISDNTTKKEYKEILKSFKENNVFKKER